MSILPSCFQRQIAEDKKGDLILRERIYRLTESKLLYGFLSLHFFCSADWRFKPGSHDTFLFWKYGFGMKHIKVDDDEDGE